MTDSPEATPAEIIATPRKRRWWWIAPLILLVVFIAIAGIFMREWYKLQRWAKTPFGPQAAVALTIERGMSKQAIAHRLKQTGLIDDDLYFLVWLKLNKHQNHNLQAGRYRIESPISPIDLIARLGHGAFERMLTIPEGWTVAQIARRLNEQGWIDAEKIWLDLAAQPVPVNVLGIELPRAEGFCFPETYQLEEGSTAETILARMFERFRHEWQSCSPDQRDPRSKKLSLFEVVTLASMIEREARSADEMPSIASVYLNRLGKGMRLQCDATVYYAIGKNWDEKLLHADLEIDHPYNTYKRGGLPPGPISNPSRAAIEAVLRPAPNDYLYYVYGGNKHHVFSRTYAEHQAATRAARKHLAGNDAPTTATKRHGSQ